MKDAELERYGDRIESFFFQWKGRQGTLSPEDFLRLKRWYNVGIPLSAVLEGIAAAFRAQQGGRDRNVEEVNSLAYCEPFVERAWRRPRPPDPA